MKKIKTLVLALFIMLAVAPSISSAQAPAPAPVPAPAAAPAPAPASSSDPNFHFGLKICPSLAWLKSDTKDMTNDGNIVGFTYGLITEFKIAPNYAFATGIDIDYRGGKLKYAPPSTTSGTTTTTTITTTTNKLEYIEIPLTLKLKTNSIGYLQYYLQVGLAPGFNIRARADGETVTQDQVSGVNQASVTTSYTDQDIMKDINVFNLSMVLGAGIEYNLTGTTNAFAGITFNNGFLDVLDSDSYKANSNYLGLNLGILF
jgi:hypothetical protein